ncbi:MAG TPA: NAD(P)H-dependent oxidoreductase [Myxococcus sp.]|nr:NAD(P)H-dependent oxidoreductase [Myxococcus sp.]
MFQLQVISVSTRPGRKGPAVAKWFHDSAVKHGNFDVRYTDLGEQGLPLFDEPNHPRLKQYQHAHTQAWSAKMDAADAFVFVTPEYNYSTPPSLLNALTYLVQEWAYKPVGFVSYGGLSGGMRSVQMTKLVLTGFKMMPIPEAVMVPNFNQLLGEDGVFRANEQHEKSAVGLLNELHRWTGALKTLR